MQTLSLANSTQIQRPSPKHAGGFCRQVFSHITLRTLALALLLPIMLSAGCAGTRPYYSEEYFDSLTLRESNRSRMVVYLDRVIKSQQIKQITITTPEHGQQSLYPRDETSPATIDWLPLQVLFAARYILNPKHKGVEADLLLHTEADGYTPVTALHELDGSVHIEMGPPLKSLLPPPERQPSREAIVKRFGVRAVRDGAGSWQPLELYALEQALTLLSTQERTILSDVAFIRHQDDAPAERGKSAKKLWGQYLGNTRETRRREILLFDAGRGEDTALFIGEPDHPYPITTFCLLHEMGHAIADYARIRIRQRKDAWLNAANRLSKEWKALRAAGQLTEERELELGQRIAALNADIADLEQRYADIRDQYKEELGPVLAAFQIVRGAAKGPTPYGRTHVAESFAESFALYKADPAALRRISPMLESWFATGGHILALREALGEDVVPLNQRRAGAQ